MSDPGFDADAVRDDLLAWYRANRRDLPWRRTRDPYAIWISEAMLQQTRVETVIPYWHRFLERFPTVEDLAAADLETVYGMWAGLGYYSRARNLHAAASAVVDRHGGALPGEASLLRELPGIGRYTAGAIASIAFDRPEPVLDGNVERVLARVLALREDVKAKATSARLWEIASSLSAGPSPGDVNQALMELGALVCTPRAPRCAACPVRPHCAAAAAGDAESLPVRAAKAPPRPVRAVAALVRRGGRALFVKRPAGGLLGGLWELPGGEIDRGEKPDDAVRRHLRERVGLELDGVTPAGEVEHVFTHRRLRLRLFRADAAAGRVRLDGFEAHRWLAPARVGELPHGALLAKALRRALPEAKGG